MKSTKLKQISTFKIVVQLAGELPETVVSKIKDCFEFEIFNPYPYFENGITKYSTLEFCYIRNIRNQKLDMYFVTEDDLKNEVQKIRNLKIKEIQRIEIIQTGGKPQQIKELFNEKLF